MAGSDGRPRCPPLARPCGAPLPVDCAGVGWPAGVCQGRLSTLGVCGGLAARRDCLASCSSTASADVQCHPPQHFFSLPAATEQSTCSRFTHDAFIRRRLAVWHAKLDDLLAKLKGRPIANKNWCRHRNAAFRVSISAASPHTLRVSLHYTAASLKPAE